jgi:hypothetical protein
MIDNPIEKSLETSRDFIKKFIPYPASLILHLLSIICSQEYNR